MTEKANINLRINGEAHCFVAPLSVADLLVLLNFQLKRVAVEKNGEIIPKSNHQESLLADGDVLEIVVAVGGG